MATALIAACITLFAIVALWLVMEAWDFVGSWDRMFHVDPAAIDRWIQQMEELNSDRPPNTGGLPYSTWIQGRFFRYHDPRFLKVGDALWQSFEDGPWKWAAQERYAAAGSNCGHYFSLAREGADAEVAFYNLKVAGRNTVEIEAAFPSILDLTYEENIYRLFVKLFAVQDGTHVMSMSRVLADVAEGGNKLTDRIGHFASRAGYDGILFFGARAIEPIRETVDRGSDVQGLNMPLAPRIAPRAFREWRKNPAFQNLVIFSGLNLVRRISAISIDGQKASENPYFNADPSRLESLTPYNNADYEERLSDMVWIADDPGQPASP